MYPALRPIAHRATRKIRWTRATESLSGFPQNLQWAARSLLRTPGVTIAVILTLALGVGGTTVMFSVVNGILIDPLPFGNSNRLVWTTNRGTRPYDAMSAPDMRDWARLVPSFEAVGSWTPSHETLDDGAVPTHVDIAEVTDNWGNAPHECQTRVKSCPNWTTRDRKTLIFAYRQPAVPNHLSS
jgi:hypothetical protein